ncbi:MAG: rRNA pseudouridine synthase, partial [Hyphomicrobiaceae bacterium]|nr:rRNA pseudouridine synthase [Hyphomicrobiaceae bacterium]
MSNTGSDDRGRRSSRPPRSGGAAQSQRPPRPRRKQVAPDTKSDGRMRIAKAMAQAGLCSRRDAERWIEAGRVAVNGQMLSSPAVDVGPGDKIVVDGQPLPAREPTQLWRYHKPRGLVTTHRDPQGRPTVFDSLPDGLPRVISVGRLDFNTEGLLLLTNDGELARHLELPATGWLRRYRVRAHGSITQADLDKLKDGIEVEGVRYGPIEASLESQKGANVWLAIGIREGKNREVRKVLSTLGLTVNRLIRVSYGPFQLLDLAPGQAEAVKRRVIVEQLGQSVAKA